MKRGIRKQMHATMESFRGAPPGTRFVKRYERRRKENPNLPRWLRISYVILGIGLLLVGVVFAFIPGPAVLFYALGLGLMANESKWIARRLDASEVWGRRQWNRMKALWSWIRSGGKREKRCRRQANRT
jgi:hypothetical protein